MRRSRDDLKSYKYNQQWIQDKTEYLEEYRTTINRITTTISDMPKRKSRGPGQYGRENSKISRLFG